MSNVERPEGEPYVGRALADGLKRVAEGKDLPMPVAKALNSLSTSLDSIKVNNIPSPQEVVAQYAPAPSPPHSPLKTTELGYITSDETTPQLGQMSANAVAMSWEVTATDIEEMGRMLEAETKRVLEIVKSTAKAIRDRGAEVHRRIEQTTIMAEQISRQCTDFRAKVVTDLLGSLKDNGGNNAT